MVGFDCLSLLFKINDNTTDSISKILCTYDIFCLSFERSQYVDITALLVITENMVSLEFFWHTTP